jgi:hypothetical protein
MGDYFWGEIHIPKRLIKGAIVGAIATQFNKDNEWVLARIKASPRNGIVTFEDDQASYGQFTELEGVFVEAGIPFDRRSCGYAEYDPEHRIFRPDSASGQLSGDVVQPTDENGHVQVGTDELKKLLRLGPVALKKKLKAVLDGLLLDERSPLEQWGSGKIKPLREPNYDIEL